MWSPLGARQSMGMNDGVIFKGIPMSKVEEVDLDLFATIKEDEKFAMSVVAVSDYWYRKGWYAGYKQSVISSKVETVMSVVIFVSACALCLGLGITIGEGRL